MTNSTKTLLWVIAESLIIFIIMSLPSNKLPSQNSFTNEFKIDKMVHTILFFVLSYSLQSHLNKKNLKKNRSQFISLILCILYGVSLEFYQKYFVTSRSFELADIFADSIGSIFGSYFYCFYDKTKEIL